MSAWITALTLAAIISLLVSLGGVVLSSLVDERLKDPHDRVLVWRSIRILAIVPFFVAVLAMNTDGWLNSPAQGDAMSGLTALDPLIEVLREASGTEPSRAAAQETPMQLSAPATTAIDIPWASLALAIYLAGALIATGRFAIRRLALSVLMAGSRSPEDDLQDLFEHWRQALQLGGRPIRLRVVDAPISPFVIGLLPRVFLPKRLAGQTVRGTAELALVHELIHIRRGDEWDRIVGEVFSVIFWFNPMLGWVERRLAHVRELACDAETLDVLGKGCRRAYAGALVEAARAEPLANSKVMAFGTQHKRSRLMRVKAIMSGKPDNRSSLGLKSFLVAGAAAILIPACAAQAMMTAALDGNAAVVAATNPAPVIAAASSALVRQSGEMSAVRAAINTSPLASLERLEALEALGDINPESMALNPANWAAIGAYAMGQSASLSLTLEDANGNPMHVSIREDDDGDYVEVDFVDDNGVRNYLVAQDEQGGQEVVSLRYEGAEEPHFRVMSAEDDTASIRLIDETGAPIRFDVREEDDDAIIEIEDLQTGEASTLRFQDTDDGQVRAPAAGRVSHVGTDTIGEEPLGPYVVIDHGTGWSTIFYNLSEISVREGQRVSYGDVVGIEGEEVHTGNYDVDFNDVNVSFVRTSSLQL